MKKDIKDQVKVLVQNGWRIEQGRKSHIKCFAPDHKTIITLGHTPSDLYAINQIGRMLRRTGYGHLAIAV